VPLVGWSQPVSRIEDRPNGYSGCVAAARDASGWVAPVTERERDTGPSGRTIVANENA